jgi:hypothetical protein
MNKSILLIVGAISCSAIYLISLHGPFIYDDVDQILFNSKLHSLNLLSNIFCDLRQIRVAQNLSFAWDWWISNGSTWSFHLTNIAIHLTNSILVWILLDRILSKGKRIDSSGRFFLREFSSFLFLVHPIQAESVAYIMGRTSLLQGTAFFLALLLFSSNSRKPFLVAIVITTSLLIKESCFLIPFVLLTYELTLGGKQLTNINRKEFCLYFGCLLFVIPFYLLLKDPLSMYDGISGLSIYPIGPYLIWQFRYYLFYFWLFVNSAGQSLIHNPPDVSWVVCAEGIAGAVLYFSAIVFACRRRLNDPIAAFMVALFLIPLLATNSFIQMINPFAEYRLYISNLPTCLLFSCIVFRLGLFIQSKLVRQVAVISLVGFFLTVSVAEQTSWSDDRALFLQSVGNYPDYYKAHLLLGGAYESHGQLSLAREEYLTATNLVKTRERLKTYRPWILLAKLDLRLKNFSESVSVLESIQLNSIQANKPPMIYYQTYLAALSELHDSVKLRKVQTQLQRDYPELKISVH